MISTDTLANVIDGDVTQYDWAPRKDQARTSSLVLLAAYVAITGAILAVGGHGGLGTLHVLVLDVAWWSTFGRSGIARSVGDLLPLFAAPALYGEIPLLIAATGGHYHDASVQHWEIAVFGSQLSQNLAVHLPVQWVSELLHAGYLAYYLLVFVPPLILLARGKRRAFSQTVLAMAATFLVCWMLFVAFPVEGPRYLWTGKAPDGPIRRLALKVLESGSSRGAAFPSSHMAVSTVQAIMTWRWQRGIAWVVSAVACLVGIGAVYGGFHYAVDVAAGALLGVGVAALVVTRSRDEPSLE